MSPIKLLQINPTLFSVNSNGNNKSLKKKAIKPEIKDTKINSNRKALLAKIKDFQKKERENKHKNEKNGSKNSGLYEVPNSITQDIQDFEGEFNKSLNFLQELSNKHTLKKRDKKNRTLKNHTDVGNNVNLELPQELKEAEINIHVPINQPIKIHENIRVTNGGQTQSSVSVPNIQSPTPNIDPFIQKPIIVPVPNDIVANISSESTSHVISQENSQLQCTSTPILPQVALSPLILSTPPPPYSNLKGSLKPTYREWLQKTQKNYRQKNENISFSDKNQISEIPNLSTITNEPQNYPKNNNQYKIKNNKSNMVLTKVPVEKINKKTRTIKYTLGKKGNKIGVLIKNSNTRKKIKDDFLKLKKKNISEIKDTLRNKNLIKAGTLAPNDVLREIYEQSILTGDVVNKNKDALIHNYFSDK